MPKRKMISLLQGCNDFTETDSDMSSEDEILINQPKRMKQNFLENTYDLEQNISDLNPKYADFSPDRKIEQNGFTPKYRKVILKPSNMIDSDTGLEKMPEFDGYQSFINAFQFFSDEEDHEITTQVSVPQISTIKKDERNGRSSLSSIKKEKINRNIRYSKTLTINWHDQFLSSHFNQDNIRFSQLNPNVRVLGYYVENFECVFMDHPSTVPIVGYLKITLIAGRASLYGYDLVLNSPVTVFSQKQTGIISITSHYCREEIMAGSQTNALYQLSTLLPYVSHERIRDYLKENMKYCSAVVLVQSSLLPPALQFLQQYSPFAVSFEKKKKEVAVESQTKHVTFAEKEENILKFGPEYEELFFTVHKHLLRINRKLPQHSKTDESEILENLSEDETIPNGPEFRNPRGYRVLISGPKKAGKSTMLRYLVNSFLNEYKEVYYLDADPGQSEFTPPGAVSLVKVTQPLLGPPFSHLRKPLKMIFTGTITPETSPPMHMRSITKLIRHFNTNFQDCILIVNTIGWLTGVGNLILDHIRDKLVPAVEINLSSKLDPLNISIERGLLKLTIGFERDAASSTKQGDNRPADMRDWALLAYLGQYIPHHLHPLSLNAFRPVSICWDNIAVYNFNKRLMYNRYYEALNGSVVALCKVKKSCMLAPTTPDYPLTLEEEPDNECLGYGFVRAVDEEKHLLYITTPLSCNTLNEFVNALLSGNILIPRDVIYEQKILNTELDYTDISKEGKTELRKAISKRSRGHSSTDRI